MWNRVKALRCFLPNRKGWYRIFQLSCVVGLLVLAFSWGRWAKLSEAKATQVQTTQKVGPYWQKLSPEERQRPLATLYGDVHVTRHDLGEYLIARLGPERIKFYVNERIIDMACKKRGITVTDAEVEAQLIDDLKKMNIPSLEAFNTHILKRFGKTLHEYKEDHIRPKLALAKFCRDQVKVTEEDIRKAFESKFGPKVKCRMIVFLKEQGFNQANKVWAEIQKDPTLFEKYARNQAIQTLSASGGVVPPIHKHFGAEHVETEAFSLTRGEISRVLPMKDGTHVILKCDERIPRSKNIEELNNESLRLALFHEVFDMKLAKKTPEVFKKLEKEADPQIFLERPNELASMAARINPELKQNIRPVMAQPKPFSQFSMPPAAIPQGN